MRDQAYALSTLTLVNLDFIGMKNHRNYDAMRSASGDRDWPVLVVNRDRGMFSDFEAQVLADGSSKCHARQRQNGNNVCDSFFCGGRFCGGLPGVHGSSPTAHPGYGLRLDHKASVSADMRPPAFAGGKHRWDRS